MGEHACRGSEVTERIDVSEVTTAGPSGSNVALNSYPDRPTELNRLIPPGERRTAWECVNLRTYGVHTYMIEN